MQERGPAAALTVRRNRLALVGLVAAVVVTGDQLAKTWAVHHLAGRDVHLVGSLRLHLTYNTGGAFSLFAGNPWVFAVAALVLLAVMVGMGRRLASPLTAVALGLVVGGAAGNLADRLFRAMKSAWALQWLCRSV